MCYSAMAEQDLKATARKLKARPHLHSFEALIRARLSDRKIRIPKAMEANFADPRSAEETRIKACIDQYNARLTREYETDLFAQTKRRADAERSLATKETKKAREDVRIATGKIEWIHGKLQALNSPALQPDDSRIFPMWYAPVVVMEEGELVIKPMRYHCRQNGKPESTDRQFDGLYNARRDSLGKYWKGLFGRQHGVMIATSFFENVALHDFENRDLRPDEKPANVVLHFNPRHAEPMLVACLWDRWQSPGKPDLLSFAAITDEPPAEVAATGHDRCIVPLKPENVARWLSPRGASIRALDALLEDRQRPYYEHQLAA
jgi:putative SOS response-associated peptidase YedK